MQINKTELIEAIAKETKLSKKDTEATVKAFTDVIATERRNNSFLTGVPALSTGSPVFLFCSELLDRRSKSTS